MRNEAALMDEMRAALRNQLPADARLKRDRGEALLITDAPAEALNGFTTAREGCFTRIYPEECWMRRLEEHFSEPPDDLSASLLRFKSDKPDRETLLLFIRGLKLLESSAPIERQRYDRDVRRHAAARLRRHASGGGLYALSLLNSLLKTRERETHSGK